MGRRFQGWGGREAQLQLEPRKGAEAKGRGWTGRTAALPGCQRWAEIQLPWWRDALTGQEAMAGKGAATSARQDAMRAVENLRMTLTYRRMAVTRSDVGRRQRGESRKLLSVDVCDHASEDGDGRPKELP